MHLIKEDTKSFAEEENIKCLLRPVMRNTGKTEAFSYPRHTNIYICTYNLLLSSSVFYYRLLLVLVRSYRLLSIDCQYRLLSVEYFSGVTCDYYGCSSYDVTWLIFGTISERKPSDRIANLTVW